LTCIPHFVQLQRQIAERFGIGRKRARQLEERLKTGLRPRLLDMLGDTEHPLPLARAVGA
jgi:hypothetical protein